MDSVCFFFAEVTDFKLRFSLFDRIPDSVTLTWKSYEKIIGVSSFVHFPLGVGSGLWLYQARRRWRGAGEVSKSAMMAFDIFDIYLIYIYIYIFDIIFDTYNIYIWYLGVAMCGRFWQQRLPSVSGWQCRIPLFCDDEMCWAQAALEHLN